MTEELYRQLIEGLDFDSASEMLGGISSEVASHRIENAPYTILENLAHAEVWQRYWLDTVEHGKAKRPGDDWPSPEADEWEPIRRSFIDGMKRAQSLAQGEVAPAVKTRLIEIALHGSYHLGQIALLKRILDRK